VIGSIGEDGRFKLWQEDVLEPPNSGRRFKLISSLKSETKVPFMSLDFKNIMTETYVAVITRDGYLSILEPTEQDRLSDWHVLHSRHVCSTPSRQDEATFRVYFHHEKAPCYPAVIAGLDKKAISLAVAAMDVVKIYRTDNQRRVYLATELTGARSLVRDVCWAGGATRGYDLIATASKDGCIRIYEMHYPSPDDNPLKPLSTSGVQVPEIVEPPNSPRGRVGARSNLTTSLASWRAGSIVESQDEATAPEKVKHVVKKVAEIAGEYGGAVWRVRFSPRGRYHYWPRLLFGFY